MGKTNLAARPYPPVPTRTAHPSRVRAVSEHYGAKRAESAQEKAERIIAAEIKRRGWTEAELHKRPKGDPTKVKLAQRLRAETVQSVGLDCSSASFGQPRLCESSAVARETGAEEVANNRN